MLCCIDCLTPLSEGHCNQCKSQVDRVLVPLNADGYYLLRSKSTEAEMLAVALEDSQNDNWLKWGCITGPADKRLVNHSKWQCLCLFEIKHSLFQGAKTALHTEVDLWQMAKRILELLVQLKMLGHTHGAILPETIHWQRPYLFFIGFRPIRASHSSERSDIHALGQLLSDLNQTTQSRSIQSFIRSLYQISTYKTALLELHKRQMPAIPLARLTSNSPDPLLHESLEDHLNRARHRSWWSPKSSSDSIHPAQLFVGMILTICAAVAGLLTFWQYLQNI